MNAQIIELNGTPAFAVIPVAEWNALLERLEDLQDRVDLKACQDNPEETFPLDFVMRKLNGEPPLKVWREYRQLSLQTLASDCGITQQMLSMIECGQTSPSTDLLCKLAKALRCDMDDLHGG